MYDNMKTTLCNMCGYNQIPSNRRTKFCNDCKKTAQSNRQKKYNLRIRAEKSKERELVLDKHFNNLDFSGLDFLINNFNKKSSIRNTKYTSHFKMNWLEVLGRYGKKQELLDAIIDEFVKFHEKTGSQSIKLFAESIGSSSKFFKHLDKEEFQKAINPEKRIHSNERLTIEIVKMRLSQYEKDISIISNEYKNSRTELTLKCHTCDFIFLRTWSKITSEKTGCPACNSNGGKFCIEDISDYVEQHGYRLLEHTGGSRTRGTEFLIQCYRGHSYLTDFVEFKTQEHKGGGSCKTCIKEGYGKSRLEVKKNMLLKMKSLGYDTDDEFTHTQDILSFRCSEGHERVTALNRIFNYPKCNECHDNIVKHTEESVSRKLCEIGLKYINGWINTKEYFTYECDCGNIDEGLYYRLLDGSRCFNCSSKKNWRLKDVVKYLDDNSCELLDEYRGYHYPMKFKCSCGRIGKKSLGSFIYTPFCRNCVIESIPTGENHHNWRPYLTDEDRNMSRNLPEYRRWRELVFQRDNYTCQCCNYHSVSLVAHHKDGYHWCKERRTDVSNGVTLCNECHDIEYLDSFHFIYGNRDNTEEQFNEWIAYRREIAI